MSKMGQVERYTQTRAPAHRVRAAHVHYFGEQLISLYPTQLIYPNPLFDPLLHSKASFKVTSYPLLDIMSRMLKQDWLD